MTTADANPEKDHDRMPDPAVAVSASETAPSTPRQMAPSTTGIDTTISFTDIMAELRADPGRTALLVLEDRFRKDGIGALGTLYRLMARLPDDDSGQEHWSQLLDLISAIWDAGHLEAAIKMLKDASLRLSPPVIFLETLRESINCGEEGLVLLQAEAKFAAGDDEGARGVLRKLDGDRSAETQAQLEAMTLARQKSRRIAFIAAGATGLFLTVAAVISISTLQDFLRDRPTFALPAFNIEQALPTLQPPGSPDVEDITSAPETLPPDAQPTAVDGAAPANTGTAATNPSIDIFSPEQDGVIPDTEPEPTPPRDETALPTPPSAEDVFNCALAFRVSAEASRQATSAQDSGISERAAHFEQQFLNACTDKGISMDELQRVAATIDADQVRRVAQTVLSQD